MRTTPFNLKELNLNLLFKFKDLEVALREKAHFRGNLGLPLYDNETKDEFIFFRLSGASYELDMFDAETCIANNVFLYRVLGYGFGPTKEVLYEVDTWVEVMNIIKEKLCMIRLLGDTQI